MPNEEIEYDSLEDYFRDHPEEEEAYYEDMAILAGCVDPRELPEDWSY